jgi:hypothetical protein
MIDLFLLCVDRDGEPGRRHQLNQLEATLQPKVQKAGGIFFGENAWQEIEVWTMAGHQLLPGWQWSYIRAERDSKEAYFEPLAEARGLDSKDDGGRKQLSVDAARRYGRIHRLCKEDIGVLHERVRSWLADGNALDWNTAFASL